MTIMKNILKQFAAWATNFKNKPFLYARLKLASSYTLGIFAVLAVFNLLVFGLFVSDLPDHLETQTTERAEEHLENVLYMADGLILIFVALMSYFLAGLALKPVEKSYKQQKKFVADAAHELRTPLAIMKTGAEVLLNEKAEKKDYIKLIKDSLVEINHLSAIVDDLLFLVKSDNLKKPQFAKLNISKLLRQQIELLNVYAKSKGIAIKENIEDELYINGDEDYLKRLLNNIIGNAIDYNKPLGEIFISLQRNKNKAELKITDTGIGISKKDLDHVFDRFYRTDQARTKQAGGAGLGLSIVKEIVEIHQSKISVKSDLNKGTIITILFPLP